MPERTSYEPGVPSWVDLATTDLEGATRFYGELFGWEARAVEPGGYHFFLLGGRRVAGAAPHRDTTNPSVWSTYVATDDADAVAERARAAGATVLAGPMDVGDTGRMVYLAHDAAGMLGAWQPGAHTGAELVHEPGTLDWSELHTPDIAAAKAFGEAVFGWRIEDAGFGGETPYEILYVGDAAAGGITEAADGAPAQWMTVFAVADCDASVGVVQEHAGAVLMPPADMEGVGRFAVVADPQGARFGVIQNAA